MKVLHLRMILNALAMLISAGGAAMLVPAAYSLLKAPEEAWVFWLPGVIVLALGAVLYYPTRRQPRSYVSRQTMFLMVVGRFRILPLLMPCLTCPKPRPTASTRS